jgi:hypothetical protein
MRDEHRGHSRSGIAQGIRGAVQELVRPLDVPRERGEQCKRLGPRNKSGFQNRAWNVGLKPRLKLVKCILWKGV